MVRVATMLWAGESGVRIPVATRDFSLLQNVQSGSEVPPSLLLNEQGGYFRGLKRP